MNVPKLRFKEFNEHWKIKELGEIFEITSGTTPSRGVEAFFKDGRHIWIKTTDLNNGLIKNTQEKVTDLALEKTSLKLLPEGSVLIAMYGGFNQIGRTGLLTQKAAINQALSAILPNTDLAHPYYLLSYLNHHVDRWKIFAASSRKDPNITKSDVKNFTVSFPALEEQTKIANFLTAIDEKITQLTQKHGLLKQYKKGVMQQIFSQKLRFKDEDGREFPKWEAKRLGDVATFHNGRAYKQSEWEDNGLPVIRLQNLTGSSTNFYYSNIQLPENQYCNNGDLLYMWSATFGPVWWYGDKAIFHYHIWKIETESMCMSRNYLYYVLDDITAKIKNTSNGSTMAHITKEGILKRAVQLPCVKEQTKIANFLTAIDDKITHTKTQLDAVKLYKKGLLQQLFV